MEVSKKFEMSILCPSSREEARAIFHLPLLLHTPTAHLYLHHDRYDTPL